MLKRIFALVVLCGLFIMPARAELKVDIIAGATDPISVAVQKFERGENVSANDVIEFSKNRFYWSYYKSRLSIKFIVKKIIKILTSQLFCYMMDLQMQTL